MHNLKALPGGKIALLVIFLFSEFAFAAQENSSYQTQKATFRVEVVTTQPDVVWGFDFLTQEKIIFTLREGALKILDLKTGMVTPVRGVPKVVAKGQGGLLDVRVYPSLMGSMKVIKKAAKPVAKNATKKATPLPGEPNAGDQKIFFTYSEPGAVGSTTAVGSGVLVNDELQQVKKIFSAHQPTDEASHFGSRIEFGEEETLFVSLGDRQQRERVQDLGFHNGKIVRLNLDGTYYKKNPFVDLLNHKPDVYSYGHRNPQGLAMDPFTGELWSTEMGPKGGDELNLVKAGANYGWPVITYGREYSGEPIGEGSAKPGMEQPKAYWVPSISPSAMTIYSGDKFPNWKGNIFVGCLSGQQLRRIELKNNLVVVQEELLIDLKERFRNVRTGLDGLLYFSTDSGKIGRLIPIKL